MKKILQFTMMLAILATTTGCPKVPNGQPCNQYMQCASGLACGPDGLCPGKPLGSDCTASEQCADNNMCVITVGGTPGKCTLQTCNPPCRDTFTCSPEPLEPNLCVPYEQLFNGAPCTERLQCASLDCQIAPQSVTGYCVGRPDGAPCGAMDSKCTSGSCNNTTFKCDPPASCTRTCLPGQDCVGSGCFDRVNLPVGMPCNKVSNCKSGICTNNVCAQSSTCTPTYPPASSVNCGNPVLPNNSCGTTPNGTGTFCSTGTCNGTTCVTTIDGAALYVSNCQSCHGPLATSTKRGRSSNVIQTAINQNAGGMGALSGLTSLQVEAISTALSNSTTVDFTVAVPSSLTVTIPATGSANFSAVVTVSTVDNSVKTVVLSSSGAPSGIGLSLNPTSVNTINTTPGTSTLSISVASTTAVGSYPITITGTRNSNTGNATLNLIVTSSGGTGKPNGASCSAHTECLQDNCGPIWSTTKTCNGSVDIDQVPPSGQPYDCHSGVFIQGTNKCAPDQFRLCVSRTGVGVQVYTDTAYAGGFYVDSNKCLTSSPALNHRSMLENGDLTGCSQRSWWTEKAGNVNGAVCVYVVPNYRATWNGGRIYPTAAAKMMKMMSMVDPADEFSWITPEVVAANHRLGYQYLPGGSFEPLEK